MKEWPRDDRPVKGEKLLIVADATCRVGPARTNRELFLKNEESKNSDPG
jgi:hypothetical protein